MWGGNDGESGVECGVDLDVEQNPDFSRESHIRNPHGILRNIIIKINYINYHKTLNTITAPIHGIILLHRTLIFVPALPGATPKLVAAVVPGVVENTEYPFELLCGFCGL